MQAAVFIDRRTSYYRPSSSATGFAPLHLNVNISLSSGGISFVDGPTSAYGTSLLVNTPAAAPSAVLSDRWTFRYRPLPAVHAALPSSQNTVNTSSTSGRAIIVGGPSLAHGIYLSLSTPISVPQTVLIACRTFSLPGHNVLTRTTPNPLNVQLQTGSI